MSKSRLELDRALQEAGHPVARGAARISYHLRRYTPLYVLATAFVMVVALVPTVEGSSGLPPLPGSGGSVSAAGGAAGGQGTAGAGGAPALAQGAAAGGALLPAGAGAGTEAGGSGSLSGGPVGQVQAGTGVTMAGVACHPGVRQIQFSLYADPCVAKFSGNNGGATAVGVTPTEVKIAIRIPSDANGPNAQAVDKVQQEAGNPSNAQRVQIADTYLAWFNKQYELYGRHVTLVNFNGQGNGTSEAQSQGQAAACADADAIATSVKAFGVIGYPFNAASQPLSDCAARYHLFVPVGLPYFPESNYVQDDPYVWGVIPQCELIAHMVGEYIGKRLLSRHAQWAGDAIYQNENRKFGVYVPDNPGYQRCVGISNQEAAKYGAGQPTQYNYALDVSQFPSEAARGVVQFKAAGVTTLVNACDPISTIFLTQQADTQQWHPEWLIIGVAQQDTDGYARLWQADQVAGHLFGLSQFGALDVGDNPNGEAAVAWKAATGGQAMPHGAWTIYYEMLSMFNQLQAAGPVLNAANIARGTRALPMGGNENAPQGPWSFTNGHTAIVGSQEVYWDSKATASDGKAGDYIPTYNGRWFQYGEWPTGAPPIKPR